MGSSFSWYKYKIISVKCTNHGKDALHPFKSGAEYLKILNNIGLFEIEQNYLEQIIKDINSFNYLRTYDQVIPFNSIKKGTVKRVHDNQKMLEFLEEQYKKGVIIKNSFIDYTFKLIVFHQAFYGIECIPPFSELSFSKNNFIYI